MSDKTDGQTTYGSDFDALRQSVDRVFTETFGQTPLRERLRDVLGQAMELGRYHLIKRLLADEQYKHQYDFALVIGQDNANTLTSWVNGEELERIARFVVVPRLGTPFDPNATWYLRPPHIYLAGGKPAMETSSTEVRRMLKENDPRLAEHIDSAVVEFIRANNLYG